MKRPSMMTLAALCFLACGTSSKFSIYKAPAQTKPKVIAIMPLSVVSAASQFTTTSGFIYAGIYTRHTQTMSPGEYLPANQAFETRVTSLFPETKLIMPQEIAAAMSGAPAETFADAVKAVPASTGADGVLALEMRDVLIKGPDYDGGSEARGTVSLTLYDSTGAVTWSIAGPVRYVAGGQLSTAPNLAEFVEEALNELIPKVGELRAHSSR